jgi:hypothetical protein
MQHTSIATKQSNVSLRAKILAYFALVLLAMPAKPARSESNQTWATGAHLGYGVNQQSSTGFKNVAGSLIFLDVLRNVKNGFEIGLRTIAQGGQESSNEYYRMGAGPMISYNFYKNWRAQFSLSFFNETANDATKERAYRSKGRTYQLGWERSRELIKNVDLAWGGFYMVHQGNVSLSDSMASSNAASTRFSNISTNKGTTRGVEVSLRFKL